MTDRELLELAAKSAGIALKFPHDPATYEPIDYVPPRRTDTWENWNPLEDDGDALRLAVKLRIDLSLWINTKSVTAKTHIGAGRGIPLHGEYTPPINAHTEPRANDEFAATRRAIVRAAAEIGKAQQ